MFFFTSHSFESILFNDFFPEMRLHEVPHPKMTDMKGISRKDL